jgi:ATP-binding cassette, subfamily B, multidrug efflux pump
VIPPGGGPSATSFRGVLHPTGRGIGKIARAADRRGTQRRLVTYFHGQRAGLAAAIACIIAYSLLGLVGPYLMGVAIDEMIGGRHLPGLLRMAAWMAAAFVASNGFQALSSWLMASLSQRALARLRGDLFDHIQALPMASSATPPAS